MTPYEWDLIALGIWMIIPVSFSVSFIWVGIEMALQKRKR